MEKVAPLDKPMSFPASSSSSSKGADCGGLDGDDLFDDACSICLECFTPQDPAAITTCKHEYHLQCILEWSQRSSECPICWQSLSLKDYESQELLAAIEKERRRRSRKASIPSSATLASFHEDFGIVHDLSSSEDFDERVLQHLVAAATSVRYVHRRERPRSSVHYRTSPEQDETSLFIGPSDNETANVRSPTSPNILPEISLSPPVINATGAAGERGLFTSRFIDSQDPINSPQGPPRASPPPDLTSFSESLKSRFSSATTRYKESFSKSTRGIKDKILARNTVKELSKGVQREMSAGIAGVTRMIERLDLTSKRSATSVCVTSHEVPASNLSVKGKGALEGAQMVDDGNTDAELCDLGTIPGRLEIIPSKEGH